MDLAFCHQLVKPREWISASGFRSAPQDRYDRYEMSGDGIAGRSMLHRALERGATGLRPLRFLMKRILAARFVSCSGVTPSEDVLFPMFRLIFAIFTNSNSVSEYGTIVRLT